jgi:riboflavin biosynthesis pyrimidine reductase
MTDGQETVLVHIQQDLVGVALPAGDGGADLNALLDHLGDRGIQELLVEGGPIVWKHFLDEQLVDRAIIIQSATELGEGPQSGLDENILIDAGLEIIENLNWDGDLVTLWSRPDLSWPTHDWP